jgi:hypothetical protein
MIIRDQNPHTHMMAEARAPAEPIPALLLRGGF